MSYILAFIAGFVVGIIVMCMYIVREMKEEGYSENMELNKVIIPKAFIEHPPRAEKMNAKMQYFIKHGKYEQPIVINSKNELIDGYTTYLLAQNGHVPPVIIKK